MKFIIIGLGTLGYTMARLLTEQGHDVIGVDSNLSRVEEYKNDISNTICMDISEYHALSSLPVKDMDGVIVAVGDSESLGIEVVAYVKQLGAKKIFARSNSNVQTAILNAIGITRIMNPSEYAAEMYALEVSGGDIQGLYSIDRDHRIYILSIPAVLVNHTVEEIGFEHNFHMRLVAIKRKTTVKNFFGKDVVVFTVLETWDDHTVLEMDDEVVLFGSDTNFSKMKKTID